MYNEEHVRWKRVDNEVGVKQEAARSEANDYQALVTEQHNRGISLVAAVWKAVIARQLLALRLTGAATSAYMERTRHRGTVVQSAGRTRSIVRLTHDAVSRLMNVQRSNHSRGGERRNGGIWNLEFDGSKVCEPL